MDEEFDTLLNPMLLIEVLSESTKEYDKGSKFSFYRSISSLKEYVTVSSLKYEVERHIRNPDGTWTLHETTDPKGQIFLQSLDFTLNMQDVYYHLEWNEEERKLSLER